MSRYLLPGLILALVGAIAPAAEPPSVTFAATEGRLAIRLGDQPIATYVYQDETISRPYFAHLFAPGGVRVSRNHPPVKGKDADDHATFHPGLWLAFGDLNQADSWRLKAPVRHVEFVAKPQGDLRQGSFTARHRYLAADGRTPIARETFRCTVHIRPALQNTAGTLIIWDSTFEPEGAELVFGDQEEMGLGVRVATPLAVKNGGTITGSDGTRNEAGVRGRPLKWCDYAGQIGETPAGVLLMPDPKNFRPCWFHARDYGFLAANPFGRQSLGRGEPSRVIVKRGESLRLRFGVLLHAGRGFDPEAAYADFLRQLGD